jgi:hypothetical protein
MGDGSKAKCEQVGSCKITCQGKCTVNCPAVGECTVTCAGGAKAQDCGGDKWVCGDPC